MYWRNNPPAQVAYLQTVCQGKRVLELGAGDCSLALALLSSGAAHVDAVDKAQAYPVHPKLRFTHSYFNEVPAKPYDVVLLAWPPNYRQAMEDVVRLSQASAQLWMLGCFDDITVCGEYPLWSFLATRPLLHQEGFPGYYLVGYNLGSTINRQPTNLERFALDTFKSS